MNTHTKSSTCVGDDESNSLNDETSQGELEEDEDSDSQQISKNNVSDIKGSSEHFISTSHDSEDIAETSHNFKILKSFKKRIRRNLISKKKSLFLMSFKKITRAILIPKRPANAATLTGCSRMLLRRKPK